MRSRLGLSRLAPLMLTLGTAACGPSLSADAQWVQWFSYRNVLDMAVSADGETVVVGHGTADETATYAPFGQYTWRPWIARVAEDGTVVDDWIGFYGQAHAVAMDAEGRAYVVLSQLRDEQYWGTPERCELRALGSDGQLRWSQQWAAPACPADVAVAGDAVVVTVSDDTQTQHLEVFELDGRPRWQQPLAEPGQLAVYGELIWLTGTVAALDTLEPLPTAWRFDALDGRQLDELRLRIGDSRALAHHVATADGLLVTTVQMGFSYGAPRFLASLDLDGRMRWEREVVPHWDDEASSSWQGSWGRPITDGRDPWIIGDERRHEPIDTESTSTRYRLNIQRWAAGGTPEGTLTQAFEDPDTDPAVVARSECPASDAESGPTLGSSAVDGVVRPDGTLLVAGRQGCRDSFLLSLGVER